MVFGVGGRGFMNASGVLGGSRLGLTFFQASTNLEFSTGVATSVENRRAAAARASKVDVARRNMATIGLDRSASQVGERRIECVSVRVRKRGREEERVKRENGSKNESKVGFVCLNDFWVLWAFYYFKAQSNITVSFFAISNK